MNKCLIKIEHVTVTFFRFSMNLTPDSMTVQGDKHPYFPWMPAVSFYSVDLCHVIVISFH